MPNLSLIKLIDALCVAWDNPSYTPVYENGALQTTYCNLFVAEVAKVMGCNDFFDPIQQRNKTADEIADWLQTEPGLVHWQEMRCVGLPSDQMTMALFSIQAWANQGYLTIAIASSKALNSQHGHICLIRPGVLKSSGKWGDVPCVANIGRENFIGRGQSGPMKGQPVGVNEAFQNMPRFYSWKGF